MQWGADWRSLGIRAVELSLAFLAAFLAHRLKWSSLWISFSGGLRGLRSSRHSMKRHDGPGISKATLPGYLPTRTEWVDRCKREDGQTGGGYPLWSCVFSPNGASSPTS